MNSLEESSPQRKLSVCPLDCPDSCGLEVQVKDGKVVSLKGEKEHPYTNGFICRKMRSYPERVYSEERLRFPLVRKGKKGAGEFSRITWDQALEICADRLLSIKKEFGGEAILPYAYAGNMGHISRSAGFPLFHKLGATRLDQTICSAAAGAGWKKQCGDLPGCPPEKAAEAKLIVAWGINIKVSNVHFWQYVSKARKKGATLLVIDPYCNQTAKSADIYIPVAPGGDSALALGALKILLKGDTLDNNFIENETEGFAELVSYLNGIGMQECAKQSGVPTEQIQQLATLLSKHKETFIRIGIGLTRNSRGAMSVRAITSLAAALGLFGGGGGRGVLLTTGAFKGDGTKLNFPNLQTQKSRTVNMIQLGQALTSLKPPIKALVVYNSNPLAVNPDAGSVRRGLARNDLFTVVHEQVMTPTAMYADLVLPATTFLENQDLYTGYGHFYLRTVEPVIEPVGEAKSNFDFFQQLALTMGFTDDVFQQTCSDRLKEYVETIQGIPEGVSSQEILAGKLVQSVKSKSDGCVLDEGDRKYCFCTTELGRESSTGYESPIACLVDQGEFADPDLCCRFPLKLITPPHQDLLNSTFGEKYRGKLGSILVHPEDAKDHSIEDGEELYVYNHRGRVRRIAEITTDTMKGVVVAEGIFWPNPIDPNGETEESGINDLTSQKLTDMGAGATFHESLVTLAPI